MLPSRWDPCLQDSFLMERIFRCYILYLIFFSAVKPNLRILCVLWSVCTFSHENPSLTRKLPLYNNLFSLPVITKSVLLLMKMHRNFLKMFLTCICGGRSGKNQSANAGSGKVSSSVKFLPSTQMQRTDMTTFPLPLILWKKPWKRSNLIR